MNHKRGKRKNARSGCLMCKSWKVNGHGKDRPDHEKFSDHIKRQAAKDQIREYK